jgi:hypothetical protein
VSYVELPFFITRFLNALQTEEGKKLDVDPDASTAGYLLMEEEWDTVLAIKYKFIEHSSILEVDINNPARFEPGDIYTVFTKIEDDKLYGFDYNLDSMFDVLSLCTYDLKKGKLDHIKLALPDGFNGSIDVSVLHCFTDLE